MAKTNTAIPTAESIPMPKFGYGEVVELDPNNPRCKNHSLLGVPLKVDTAVPKVSRGGAFGGYDLKCKTEGGNTYTASEVFFIASERAFTPPKPFVMGEVVLHKGKPNSKNWTYAPGQWFVVIKENADTVTIAKLGGDGNRYWRVPPSALVRVDVANYWDESEVA